MESIFNSPNPILFGMGTSKQTGEKLKEFGCKKVLVVFDQGIKKVGVADKIINIINEAGIETVVYDNVQADPPIWSVEEAGILGANEKVDGVVGDIIIRQTGRIYDDWNEYGHELNINDLVTHPYK